ncbi:hypothetical protein [Kineococcus sp. SYSU DK003]|uniref:hypothetical protein n=1 Tax=Kineococcus sp. SYSU DK003 TaxID=3383124 RepID=UPI003D7ED853
MQRPTATASGAPLPRMNPQQLRSPATSSAMARFAGVQPPQPGQDLGQLLRSVYGASPRDPQRPDLRAAAADLGMSARQLRRWANGESRPRATNPALQRLQRLSRTVLDSRAGRARALGAQAPAQPAAARTIRIGGVQGVVSGNDDAYRDRTIEVDLTPAEYAELQRLWVEHGNAGLADGLHALTDRNYYEQWHFQSIDSIQWGDRGRGR